MIQTTASPASENTSESSALRGVQKLQRAIIDGLEDVKAQDIVVFNTAHLTSLFERVIVASGTSNRQTKALAASVRDAVRDAGFQKPRIEGEDNGEWIVVDCGAAVAHIMQPTIRAYYHLEEIWGDKPVRVKFGAAKPAAPADFVKAKTQTDTSYAGRSPGAAKTAQRAAEQLAKAEAIAAKAPRKRASSASSASGNSAAAGKSATAKPGAAKKVAVKKAAVSASAAVKSPAPAKASPAKLSPAKAAPASGSPAAKKAATKKAAATKPATKAAPKPASRA